MKAARITLVTLGIASLACAALGLLYNLATVSAALSGALEEIETEVGQELPGFHLVFYTMWSICTAFYLGLLLCGVQFLRLKVNYTFGFALIQLLEVLYVLLIGVLWGHAENGATIAAATGVANGGLMIQFFVLLPLWGPIAAFLARGRLLRGGAETAEEQSQV